MKIKTMIELLQREDPEAHILVSDDAVWMHITGWERWRFRDEESLKRGVGMLHPDDDEDGVPAILLTKSCSI